MSKQVKVIVLGGCGFIGCYIVAELLETNVASHIRVVDKVPPQMAWLSSHHKKYFDRPEVAFKSANLINPASCEAAFEGEEFDWVINAAGETKAGQEELVYKEGILKVSLNAIRAAANKSVKIYLEISSGMMASSEKKQHLETDDCLPWSLCSKFKYEAEKQLQQIPDLPCIIVRPAIVYGPGDRRGITPRLLVGAICRYVNTDMQLLWHKGLKMNTVHVKDLARAVVWLCNRGRTGQIYNVVDSGKTTQLQISELVAKIFDLKFSFCGNPLSKLAMSDATETVELINEKHLLPWLELCTSGSVSNTPLTPYVDLEALHSKHLNLDGSKLRSEGFKYECDAPSFENLKEVLDDFIARGLLPKDIYSCKK